MNHRFAKVIATMWPSIGKETILKRLVNFVDIFRINFSHGWISSLEKYVNIIRKIDASKAIMLDTKWPEIRVKNKNNLNLKKKKKISIQFSDKVVNSDEVLYIDYPFIEDLRKNILISIDDNKILLKIEKIDKNQIIAKVVLWDEILPNKSVSFQGYTPKLNFLTEEDKKWLLWAIKNSIVFVAASFVRTWEDILQLKEFLNKNWGEFIRIISKIETLDAVENIEDIIKLSDAIMIARGDLGSALPLEELTKVTLNIIKLSVRYWKPVIIATQVLPTMVENKIPTRAEIDEIVFNMKIWVDAFMLSDETAIWQNPYEVLDWLNKIIISNYNVVDGLLSDNEMIIQHDYKITDNIIWSAYELANKLDVKAIICPTETWYTPARLSTLKPKVPIIAFTRNDDTFKFLNLLWGVKGYKISNNFDYTRIKTLWKEMVRILLKWNVNIDDRILIVHSSIAQNVPWMINWLEVYKFKDL